MIYNVPDPPLESKITVEPGAYELRLSWGGRRSTGRLVLSVVGSVIMAAAGAAMQFIGPSRSEVWVLNVVIGFGFLAFVVTLAQDYRALRPETLLLRLEGLTHTAGGKNSAAAPVHAPLMSFRLRNPPRHRELLRAEVGESGAGSRDGKAFVTVAVADGRTLEMGWGLGEADREWLVSVLRRWKESAA